MITQETIQEITKRLVDVYAPEKIYLFGSYVWGTPEAGSSDLDILIVIKESSEKSYKRSYAGSWALLDYMIPNDILVYTEKEFEELAKNSSSLCNKIKNKGRVLYARC